MNTYARQPVAFVRGQGVWLWDDAGRRYLDALAGIAVNTLGHAHPRLLAALGEQLQRLVHSSNLFRIPEQERAAELLAEVAGMDEVFFCNSGLEANECAIKIARRYGHARGYTEPAIVVMERAFHGRSLATLSASGSRKVQAGFEPLVQGFVRVPFADLEAVAQIAARHRQVAAVWIEPIQGEGGVRPAQSEYLRGLRHLCDEHGWLLMADEVQCGLGRTGHWFAIQQAGIRPDVLTVAKGLGSGIPVGACLAAGRAAGVLGPGSHGSTFGGNPLAMVAAATTLETIRDEGLLANALRSGEAIRDGLAAALAGRPGVVDVRGAGLMIGVELDRPCGEVVPAALAAGLVVNVTAESVIRLLPALVIGQAEAREVVARLVPVVRAFVEGAQGRAAVH